ncbi:unnamed protein product [Amoebophrya sp. A120]|nr:unnamed protein product [Amoebophrya sp. A120]|eukprot:GSA120T00013653001.1
MAWGSDNLCYNMTNDKVVNCKTDTEYGCWDKAHPNRGAQCKDEQGQPVPPAQYGRSRNRRMTASPARPKIPCAPSTMNTTVRSKTFACTTTMTSAPPPNPVSLRSAGARLTARLVSGTRPTWKRCPGACAT